MNTRKPSKNNSCDQQIPSASLATASKCLQIELVKLVKSGIPSISAFPQDDNINKWRATIEGPKDTVYEGLTYKLSMWFPDMYPMYPPEVKFITPCFHPNVNYDTGIICLDILKENWSATLEVKTILLSIQSLLSEPNILSPLNTDAAQLWNTPEDFKAKLLQFYNRDVKKMHILKLKHLI